jgi:hypothetical protein
VTTVPNAGLVCPKCGETMQEGYLIDYSHGNAKVGRWVEGPPVAGILWEVDPTGSTEWKVATFRCRGCGFLESYARGR